MQRRLLLLGLIPVGLLSACGTVPGSSPTVPLAQLKVYLNDLVNAVSAAGQAFLAGPPLPTPAQATVINTLTSDLQNLNAVVQTVTDPTNLKTDVIQVLAAVNQILPTVSPFLGAAAPYVPLVIAVVQAFIQSLPPPPAAPAEPPAALHRVALRYKHH